MDPNAPLSVQLQAANAYAALTSPDTKNYGDYSETEGDRILEERLKAEVPGAPGERGWPECEADVEEPSAMSKYFKTKSKDKDDDPYKGFEKILRDIYGEDWRAILAEMRKRGNT
jgi:hypothetical protein